MSFWTDIRDAVESVAVVVGNYFIPGSSLLTSKLASKGSQELLSSDIGMIAQIGSSIYGGMSDLSMGEKLGQFGIDLGGGAGTAASGWSAATPANSGAGMIEAANTGASTTAGFQAAEGGVNAAAAVQDANAAASTAQPAQAAASNLNVAKQTKSIADMSAGEMAGSAWNKISGFVEKNPMASMMMANTAISGMAGVEAAKQKQAQLDYERSLTERANANANAKFTIPVSAKPFSAKPYNQNAGMISQNRALE